MYCIIENNDKINFKNKEIVCNHQDSFFFFQNSSSKVNKISWASLSLFMRRYMICWSLRILTPAMLLKVFWISDSIPGPRISMLINTVPNLWIVLFSSREPQENHYPLELWRSRQIQYHKVKCLWFKQKWWLILISKKSTTV